MSDPGQRTTGVLRRGEVRWARDRAVPYVARLMGCHASGSSATRRVLVAIRIQTRGGNGPVMPAL